MQKAGKLRVEMASWAPESGSAYKAFALPLATHDVRNDDDTVYCTRLHSDPVKELVAVYEQILRKIGPVERNRRRACRNGNWAAGPLRWSVIHTRDLIRK